MPSNYVLSVPRGDPRSVASDPDQTISNSGGYAYDKHITIKNAAAISVGGVYAKRTMSAVGGAIINQSGNARIERELNIARRGLGYGAFALATGGVVVPIITFVGDVAIGAVDTIQENQQIRFENERKVSVRGGLTALNGTYD